MKRMTPEDFLFAELANEVEARQERRAAKPAKPPKTAKDCRSHAKEEKAAQRSLTSSLVDARLSLAATTSPQVVQIAQTLVLCGLPYRKTDERTIVRRSRAADGTTVTVTFQAHRSETPLPYGSDRSVLHWATDRAIKTGSPLVDWNSATRFLSDMKMTDCGPNYARLREAFRRLSGFSVTVERVTETNEKLAILPVFESSNIPRLHPSPKVLPIQGHEQEYEQTGILFGSTFYKEIVRHHVPFPLDVLRSVYRKPQMSDYMMFLHWRVFAAQSETVIPWHMMREQLWQEDSNLYRMRTRFQEVIKAFKVVWPELTAEARSTGLYIAPIRSGRYLIPGAGNRRTLPY